MGRRATLLILLVLVGTFVLKLAGPAAAEGPWRGQVVDANSGNPLEGVVVVGVWYRLRPGMVHEARDLHGVEEVLTDTEGRFVLSERDLSYVGLERIEGPRLYMYKGGFSGWDFHDPWLKQVGIERVDARGVTRRTYIREALDHLTRSGTVFQLIALPTLAERRAFTPRSPFLVPSDRVPRFWEAVEQERRLIR